MIVTMVAGVFCLLFTGSEVKSELLINERLLITLSGFHPTQKLDKTTLVDCLKECEMV